MDDGGGSRADGPARDDEHRASEHARDLIFLALAGLERLHRLGFHYGNIRSRHQHDRLGVPTGTDSLVLTWTDVVSVGHGQARQRVCVSVLGPQVHSSRTLRRQVLGTASEALMGCVTSPVLRVTLSRPRISQLVDGELVDTGFDVHIVLG